MSDFTARDMTPAPDLICFHCLGEGVGEVPAVTMHNGTAACAKCARQVWYEQQSIVNTGRPRRLGDT